MNTIIFDFGNVIGFFDHRVIADRLAEHSDLPKEFLHQLLFDSALEGDYEKGLLTTAEFLGRVKTTCRLSCSHEEIATAYADIFCPNREVCEFIPQLKPGYRLLLGSNTTELHTAQFRGQFAATLSAFDHLVLSHEIGARKPNQAFFEHCVERAEAPANECLFIDDLPANVEGAKACGLQAVQYMDFSSLRSQLKALGVPSTT